MNNQSIVAAYYPKVDAGDVEWVIDLFAPVSVYERADSRYVGKDEITRFYAGLRRPLRKLQTTRVWGGRPCTGTSSRARC